MPTPHALAWGGSTGPPDISLSRFACLAARRPEPKRFCSQDYDAVFEAEDGRRAQPIRRGHQTQAKDGRCLAPTRPFDRTRSIPLSAVSPFSSESRQQPLTINDMSPFTWTADLAKASQQGGAAGRSPGAAQPAAAQTPQGGPSRIFDVFSSMVATELHLFGRSATLQRRSAMRVGECGARASGGSLRLAGTSLTG